MVKKEAGEVLVPLRLHDDDDDGENAFVYGDTEDNPSTISMDNIEYLLVGMWIIVFKCK